MGSVVDEDIGYLDATAAATPSTSPWTEVGTPGTVTQQADGWKLGRTITGERWMWWRHVRELDTDTSRSRSDEVVEIGATLQITTTFADATEGYALYVSDGVRSIAVVLLGNSTIAWYDPSTKTVLRTIVVTANAPYGGASLGAVWDGFRRQRYLLRKERGEGFELVVDGRVIDTFGYDVAPVSLGIPTATGTFDATVTSAVVAHGWVQESVAFAGLVIDEIESALNLRIAGGWRVDRLIADLPTSMQKRLPDFWRKVARASSGLVEAPLRSLSKVRGLYTARRQFDTREADINYRSAGGKILPSAEQPTWAISASGGATMTIVRDRIRFSGAVGGIVEAFQPWTSTAGLGYGKHEVFARCDLALVTTSLTGGGAGLYRTGATLWCEDGVKGVAAMIVRDGSVGTSLSVSFLDTQPLLAGDRLPAPGCTPWPINAFRANRIEVYLFSPDWALLVVDGKVVQKLAYADMFAAAYFPSQGWAGIGLYDPAGLTTRFDFENASIGRRSADQSRRSMFLQDTVERGYALGGCERNDELEEWARNWNGTHDLRGTTQNLLLELKRLACSADDVAVRAEEAEADWFLEVTYPETTPIFLDGDGLLRIITAEYPDTIRNLTPQGVADWLVRYVLPISTVEFVYRAALAYALTGNTVAGPSTTTDCTISTTRHLAVGDAVELVASAGAGAVTRTTVTAIVSATIVRVDGDTPHLTGDIFRKVYATS